MNTRVYRDCKLRGWVSARHTKYPTPVGYQPARFPADAKVDNVTWICRHFAHGTTRKLLRCILDSHWFAESERMNGQRTTRFVRVLLCSAVCLCAFAQQRLPNVTLLRLSSLDAAKDGGGPAAKEVPLREKLTLARAATTSAFSSQEAEAVIETALRTNELKFALPRPESTAILTHAGEDIVIASGRFEDQPQGITNYILWNEPASESLLLRVPPDAIRTADGVQRLLSAILDWDPKIRANLTIAFAEPRRDGIEFLRASTTDNDFRQYPTIKDGISSAIDGTDAWLSITYRHSRAYPPEMVNFPERFPPLRVRVEHWSTSQLIAAIDNPGRARYMVSGAVARASFLMQELFTRPDFSGDDFRKLTSIVISRGAAKAVPLAIEEAMRAGVDERYAPEIIDYFRHRISQGPGAASFVAPSYMRFLNTRAINGYCDDAVQFLESRAAITESLRYIGHFCHTRRAFEAVSSLEDPIYSKDRAIALAQIGNPTD